MKITTNSVLKVAVPVAVATAAVVVPDIAFADAAGAIDSAIASGETLVGKLAPGLITIAALMTGVYLVVSAIRK